MKFCFVRIPRTASTSIKRALGVPRLGHVYASAFIEKIGKKEWDKRFTFAFVRNPWDRVVSWYHQIQRTKIQDKETYPEKQYGFEVWVKAGCPYYLKECDPIRQLPWLTWNNQIVVNFVGKFENLKQDFNYVCQQLGKNVSLEKRKYERSNHDPYRKYYNTNTKQIIADMFQEEIDVFQYTF